MRRNRRLETYNFLIGEVEVFPHELIENKKRPFKTMLQVDITTGEKLIDRREEVYWR